MARHPYDVAHDAFVEAVANCDAGAVVPACPAWTVHDLLAHQVHQLRGALDGSFPVGDALSRLSAATPAERESAAERQERWIADGIAQSRARPVADLLNEWAQLASSAPLEVRDSLVPDVVVHLFDLLGVAGVSAYRDHEITTAALRFWARAADVPLPPDHREHFELLRAITGRRSRRQAAELEDRVAVYGWRTTDLTE